MVALESSWKQIGKEFPTDFTGILLDLELQETRSFMHNDLILLAFEKSINSLEEKQAVAPSKSKAAELLSDYIEEQMGFQIGERRLRDYYNAALKEEEIEIKQQAVRDGLAKYLGSENFEGWLIKENEIQKQQELGYSEEIQSKPDFIRDFLIRNKTTALIGIAGLIVYLTINSFNTEKWMVWDGNQFVETSFDGRQVEIGKIKLLDENRLENFKRIVPNCDTQFFNPQGNAQVWYGKNPKGELEFFTELGRHPQTGKTLKPITRYMINKYVCPL